MIDRAEELLSGLLDFEASSLSLVGVLSIVLWSVPIASSHTSSSPLIGPEALAIGRGVVVAGTSVLGLGLELAVSPLHPELIRTKMTAASAALLRAAHMRCHRRDVDAGGLCAPVRALTT